MKPDEIKYLLGAYSTGTLTPEEQRALFDAALEDQDLFDALAREEALRETLAQPSVRRELSEALAAKPSWRDRLDAWWRWQYPVAVGGALAVAIFTVVAVGRYSRTSQPSRPATQVAEVRRSEPQLPSAPEPAPPSLQPPDALSRAPVPAQKYSASRRVLDRPDTVPEAAPPGGIVGGIIAAAPPPPASTAPPAVILEAPPPPAPPKVEALSAVTHDREQEKSLARNDLLTIKEQPVAEAQPAAPLVSARAIFYYGARNQPAATSGVVGGVPGRSPRSVPMMGARAKWASAPEPLGLRYSVEGRRLIVEANTAGVLYLFRRTAYGDWMPVTGGGMSLTSHTPATTPEITVDAGAQAPRALLLLSRAALPQLAETGAELTTALERLRSQWDASMFLTQTVAGSTYIVMAAAQPGAVVIAPVPLP